MAEVIDVTSKFWEGVDRQQALKQKWMSDASRHWNRRVEGFREDIAIDGSSKGVSGRDAACGWLVGATQKGAVICNPWCESGGVGSAENDQQSRAMGFYHGVGMCGWWTLHHPDKMGIIDGLWRREEGCMGLKQNDADLWIKLLELQRRIGTWT